MNSDVQGRYKSWKQGQVTQEKSRDAVLSSRVGVKKAKANLKLKIVKKTKKRILQDSNMQFY